MLPDEFDQLCQQYIAQYTSTIAPYTAIKTELYNWILQGWLPYPQQQLFFGMDWTAIAAGAAFNWCVAIAERIRELELPEPARMTDAEIFDACYRELVRRWGPAPYEP